MNMSAQAPPSERQLRYLRSLAARTASTFAQPVTRREASREIDRLIALSRSHTRPPYDAYRDEEQPLGYATAVRDEEITGFGSTARWRSQARTGVGPGESNPLGSSRPVRLASYSVTAGERVLTVERAGDELQIRDIPGRGDGLSYPVEQLSAGEGRPALQALLADYVRTAGELDEIPMADRALALMLGCGGER
jgi:hypothetical protein